MVCVEWDTIVFCETFLIQRLFIDGRFLQRFVRISFRPVFWRRNLSAHLNILKYRVFAEHIILIDVVLTLNVWPSLILSGENHNTFPTLFSLWPVIVQMSSLLHGVLIPKL